LDRAADGQVTEIDQLLGDPGKPDDLVWSSEVLGTGLGHRHMLIPVAHRVNDASHAMAVMVGFRRHGTIRLPAEWRAGGCGRRAVS
jgi:hypothetical protein